MSHSRKLPDKAKEEMKEFYQKMPEYQDLIKTAEFNYNVLGIKPPSPLCPIFFKPKKLKHYDQIKIEDVKKDITKSI